MAWELKGRTALVTGAARGLGAGVAQRLARQGMNVVLVGLEPERLAGVARPLGEQALVIEADVTSLEAMTTAVQSAVEHFGGIDVVVANAGITAMAPVAEIDPEQFRRVIDVNLMGVFNTLHASAEAVFSRQGYFLVVSSMAAAVQSPLQGHYCASKAGVTALANCFRLEARAEGAEVGVIQPTFAATDLMKFTHSSAAGKAIWNGNRGLWKMVDAEQVIAAMERAIVKRRRAVAVPRSLRLMTLAPGLFQPLLERSFPVNRIRAMLAAFRSETTQQTSQSIGEQTS